MRNSTLIFAAASAAVLSAGCEESSTSPDSFFERQTVHVTDDEAAPWAKFVGDLDGDGNLELFVGYHGTGEIVQIAADGTVTNPIARQHAVLTDGAIVDLDADGANDIVLLTRHGLFAFFAPDFSALQLSPERFHDVRFVDENGDGKLEIVARNQSAFGTGHGDVRVLAGRRGIIPWQEKTLLESEGEGIETADLDADGDADIVLAGLWLENRGDGEWVSRAISTAWDWPHAKVAVADIDGDGRLDVAFAPAEPVDQRYKIAWYRQDDLESDSWSEQIILEDIESVVHSLQAGDVDRDGDTDLVYAEMHQGSDPDRVALLENRLDHGWREWPVDDEGSHNVVLFDRDVDGDLDIAGANWDGERQDVQVWQNTVCDEPWAGWSRRVIDDGRPGQAVFVLSADLNGDSWPDVVSGSMAYLNPGSDGTDWRRIVLGAESIDAAAAWDVDADGDVDILAAMYEPDRPRFVLLVNDGGAVFEISDTGIAMSGDFLQGVAYLGEPTPRGVVLSWHEPGKGLEYLQSPLSPSDRWEISRLSDFSQDEGLSSGDVDADGDTDLVLGTRWLRNDDPGWSIEVIDDTHDLPDRNVLADINGDGKEDVVVGFQAISEPGDIAWYESEDGTWVRHEVGTITGPMSVGAADVDGDGDIDIVAGEHNLEDPDSAMLWIFENISGDGAKWEARAIYQGDEHHDGAQVVDIDLDGDPDILSIGWGHDDVIWYVNRMPACPTQGN